MDQVKVLRTWPRTKEEKMRNPAKFGSFLLVLVSSMLLAGSAPAKKADFRINKLLSAGAWAEKSGISIAPLYLSYPDRSVYYLSLDEATKAGDIKVIESESVNELLVENTSKKPVLLIAGEVVGGGKQDRMVGKDMILPPGKIRRINVFCVEQGRWRYETAGAKGFKSSSLIVGQKIRMEAQKKGGTSENQSAVWSEVSKSLDKYGVSSRTSNYKQVLKSDKMKDGEGIIEFFIEAFEKDERIGGLALAYNGEVQSIEQFANPALFSKYRDKLIRSYVISALKELDESKNIDMEMLKSFVNKDLTGETHQFKTDFEIVIESRAGDIESFELQTTKGEMVHYSRFRK
jgi:hypothetical protein